MTKVFILSVATPTSENLFGTFYKTKEDAAKGMIDHFVYTHGIKIDNDHIYTSVFNRVYSDEEEMDGAPDTYESLADLIVRTNQFQFPNQTFLYKINQIQLVDNENLSDTEEEKPSWWKNMSEDQKKDYLDRELDEISAAMSEGRAIRYVRKTYSNRPKRPMTAWNFYVHDMNKRFPNNHYSKFSEWWKKLDSESRQKYVDLADADRTRWKSDCNTLSTPTTESNTLSLSSQSIDQHIKCTNIPKDENWVHI